MAVIRSTDGEIPTPANQQMLREAGKSLRESCKDDWIIRPNRRAGQAISERHDGPFMTDVASGQRRRVAK
ncbi:MAG TPA: hypothetical protein VGP94_13635 [Tepidisphaeraceae bacterium]|nr:hypothetical protein [Tepidisphaeraceae bacterium]